MNRQSNGRGDSSAINAETSNERKKYDFDKAGYDAKARINEASILDSDDEVDGRNRMKPDLISVSALRPQQRLLEPLYVIIEEPTDYGYLQLHCEDGQPQQGILQKVEHY